MNMPNYSRPFILAATDHGPLIFNHLDVHYLPHAAYGVGFQLLSKGHYDAEEVKEIRSLVDDLHQQRKRDIIALDCGANIGVMTIELGKHLSSRGKVFAFEPQERLFYALCGNIALNNLFNCRVFNYALGNEDAEITCPQPDYTTRGSFGSLEMRFSTNTEFIGQSISYSHGLPVKMMTIDSFVESLNLPHVDFIKLDIEGMESEALQGAINTISNHHPALVIEWIKVGRDPLEQFLHSHQYQTRVLGQNIIAT
jgi:FkbM family methyltransferase